MDNYFYSLEMLLACPFYDFVVRRVEDSIARDISEEENK